MKKQEIEKDIPVMYIPATSFPEGIQAAFENIGSSLAFDDDRAIFGLSWPDENGKIMYKAAAAEKYKGEAEKYGLGSFTIKKGTYISELVKNYKKNVSQIAVTFQQLLRHPELDTSSYCLEWYKGNDDVLCLVKLDPGDRKTEEQKKSKQ